MTDPTPPLTDADLARLRELQVAAAATPWMETAPFTRALRHYASALFAAAEERDALRKIVDSTGDTINGLHSAGEELAEGRDAAIRERDEARARAFEAGVESGRCAAVGGGVPVEAGAGEEGQGAVSSDPMTAPERAEALVRDNPDGAARMLVASFDLMVEASEVVRAMCATSGAFGVDVNEHPLTVATARWMLAAMRTGYMPSDLIPPGMRDP